LVTHYMGASVLSNVFTRLNAMEGTRDLLAVRLDNNDGSVKWVHTGNSINDDWISSVAFDRMGSTYILGDVITDIVYDTYTFTDATGNGGFYLVKINYNGEITFGRANFNQGEGHLYGQKICADAFGNLYLQGNFSGTDNVLDEIPVESLWSSGLFTSKFSYSTTITGRVTNADGTPMPSGMVKVYGYTRFQRSPLSDSAIIEANGEYILGNIPFGRYILYAIPDNDFNADAVPTYFPNGSNWQDAEQLLISTTEPLAGIDILLKEIPQNAGTATLGGLVFEADTTNIFKSSDAVQAKPVKKANVVLVGKTKAYANVIAFTETDDYGNFSFLDIFDGGYTIIVDIPGMPHNSYYDIEVTGGQIIMNLDHLVGEEEIEALYGTTAIPEGKTISDNIAVFPNPCTGTLFIYNKTLTSDVTEIEIFDLSGILLYQKTLHRQTGINALDLRSLQKGVYLLRVTDGDASYSEKLSIQ
ncbi:MAG: T9SS type A sorting domain-containing protein, partial [Bacteroidales bacterium]|nr:T9SS type A sorting domain-containing protein [Bacteroidales bacterium]